MASRNLNSVALVRATQQVQKRLKDYKKGVQDPVKKWKVLRGDNVQVLAGKDKGKNGKVLQCIRQENKVLVEGINLVKKAVPRQGDQPGRLVIQESPLHYSKVAVLDPEDGLPTRVGFRFLADGEKVRVSKRTGAIIQRPRVLLEGKPARDEGHLDTSVDVALEKTHIK